MGGIAYTAPIALSSFPTIKESKPMKRAIPLLLLFILFALPLLACGSNSTASPTRRPSAAPTNTWYQGGTLHSATVAEWLEATSPNRLATAGDWVTVTVGWTDLDEARQRADALVACVNESAPVSPPEMNVTDLGGACLTIFDWESRK